MDIVLCFDIIYFLKKYIAKQSGRIGDKETWAREKKKQLATRFSQEIDKDRAKERKKNRLLENITVLN